MEHVRQARNLGNEGTRLFEDLRHNYPSVRNMLLTGCNGGEGTTTLSLALAMAARKLDDARILLIDADFADAALSRSIGAGDAEGLRDLGDNPGDYTRHLIRLEDGTSVLPAGRLPVDMADLKRDGTLQALVDAALVSHDFVFWDTEAINGSANTKILMAVVPDVILVTESDRTRMDHFTACLHEIASLRARTLAVLRNRAGRRAFSMGADQQ